MEKIVVIGSDHAGYPLKNAIRDNLTTEGYTVIDVGTDSPASVIIRSMPQRLLMPSWQGRHRSESCAAEPESA